MYVSHCFLTPMPLPMPLPLCLCASCLPIVDWLAAYCCSYWLPGCLLLLVSPAINRRSAGEDSVKDSMKAFMFYKMVRDCSMLDNLLSYERVDLIFAESVGKADKGPKGRKRLSYNQFVLAVSSLAKTKFPQLDTFDAFLRLCEEYVIPLARRVRSACMLSICVVCTAQNH